jgi:CTP:phosphocholine cytidylyltransferase-like protein
MVNKYKVDNAVILAAGRGRRLNELTKDVPKPLLENKNGVPLIEDIIMKLQEKGIMKIFIIIGYK